MCLLFVGKEELVWKGTEVQLLRKKKGSLKVSEVPPRKRIILFILLPFLIWHTFCHSFFLSICTLRPPFTYFAHSFFLPLCGKFNGFLGSEQDILSLGTIITRVRATSCNSLTPSLTGYDWVFCLCAYSVLCVCTCMPHLKSAWSAKTRYCRLVKPSGWAPRLLLSKSAYSGLQNNRHGQVLTHIHTPRQRNGKSLQRGMDLLLLVRPKIKKWKCIKWKQMKRWTHFASCWSWMVVVTGGQRNKTWWEKSVNKHAKADHVKSWTSGNIRCIMPDRVYCLGCNFTVTSLLF